MRLSRGGLILVGCYLALAAASLLSGALHGEFKTTYVLFQLAVWPGLMLVMGPAMLIGPVAEAWLQESWLNSLPAMLALNVALAYAVGWALGWMRARVRAGER